MKLRQTLKVLILVLIISSIFLDGSEAKKKKRDRKKQTRKGGRTDSRKRARHGKQTVEACGLPDCVRDKSLAKCRSEVVADGTVTLPDISQASLEEVNITATATIKHLEKFNLSLESLVSRRSDVYPRRGMKELYPTVSKTKLITDQTPYKVLGQMVYWLTWTDAALQAMHKISKRSKNPSELLPLVTESNGNVVNLSTLREDLLRVKRSLHVLIYYLAGSVKLDELQNRKGSKKVANPFECRKVRVTSACGKKSAGPICSEELDRAYIVVRDSGEAVKRMLRMLADCRVEEGSGKGGDSSRFYLECKQKTVFYMKQCVKELSPIQKKRWKCIAWGYV